MKYVITETPEVTVVSVFMDDGEVVAFTSYESSFGTALALVKDDDESFLDLVNVRRGIQKRLEDEELGDTVEIKDGKVLWLGKELEPELADYLVGLYREGRSKLTPFVNFLDRLSDNPSYNSRKQLLAFIKANGMTITDDGFIVGYKSVLKNTAGQLEDWLSMSSGTAYVNGVKQEGQIPQSVGDTVTMPREEIDDNSTNHCSAGLHVAAWEYATTWHLYDAVLKVIVDPEDVVSVPEDASARKMRVCRYQIAGLANEKIDSFVDNSVVEVEDYDIDADYYSDSYDNGYGFN